MLATSPVPGRSTRQNSLTCCLTARKDFITLPKEAAAKGAVFSFANTLIGLVLLLSANDAQGSVIPITSIAEISGTTIDFEQAGETANAILPAFDMVATPDRSIITFIPGITGTSSAPISDRALFSDGF